MNHQLNLETCYGDDLHDYPENPEHIQKFIESEIQNIEKLEGDEKFKRISQLAVYYRLLRNFDKAHELFKLASSYFENNSSKMEMVNFLRWSDVFRFEKRFHEAFDLLNKVGNIISTHLFADYEDFYFQHLGKLHFDMADYIKALECFEKALSLRLCKGNPELIQSTEFALKRVNQKRK